MEQCVFCNGFFGDKAGTFKTILSKSPDEKALYPLTRLAHPSCWDIQGDETKVNAERRNAILIPYYAVRRGENVEANKSILFELVPNLVVEPLELDQNPAEEDLEPRPDTPKKGIERSIE